MHDIILVDEDDRELGTGEKMNIHREGILHRAFSIFVFDSTGRLLLQQRSTSKYHSGGLWTNTCCSHPFPGEAVETAAIRRLREEMGFETPLKKVFHFVYRAELDQGLTEHEFDHVFVGEFEGQVRINPDEVRDHIYRDMRDLKQEMNDHPSRFTAWFLIAFPRLETWWAEHYKN